VVGRRICECTDRRLALGGKSAPLSPGERVRSGRIQLLLEGSLCCVLAGSSFTLPEDGRTDGGGKFRWAGDAELTRVAVRLPPTWARLRASGRHNFAGARNGTGLDAPQGHLARVMEAWWGTGQFRWPPRSHRRSLIGLAFHSEFAFSLQIRLEHTRFPQQPVQGIEPHRYFCGGRRGVGRRTLSDLATTISALAAAAQFP
jgi:hypothetical protein